jgi:8-oxo-dGTP pyrophosphatase MutT (NUDIX family)
MEPLLNKKGGVAVLLPYRKSGDQYEFFLQKRDANPENDPNIFSMFGGHFDDDENPEEAFRRELMEELEYLPSQSRYFARFMRLGVPFHVFIEQVPEGFEDSVVVHEGEYGKFLKTSNILYSKEVSLIAQLVVFHLSDYLLKE